MELCGLGLWGCGVDGIYDYGVLFGFLLNFMIFSLFFEVRKKTGRDGVIWTPDSVSACSITYSKVGQVPANKISIFFVELCKL